jgi:hypothetical protein
VPHNKRIYAALSFVKPKAQYNERMEWLTRVQRELQIAEHAKASGKDGLARVAARRAAGWTVEAYLAEQQIDLQTTSVLEHFRYLQKQGDTPAELQPILEHLLQKKMRDSLDTEAYWPLDADLVAEAKQLLFILFPQHSI